MYIFYHFSRAYEKSSLTRRGKIYYNRHMEKLIKIIVGFGLLYGTYALFLKKWDYTSQAKRAEEKQHLKEEGLSSCYFFILPDRLLLLNLLSGGFFFFYWSYKQWQAVLIGYKNLAGTRPKFGPFVRSIFGLFTFYQLLAIVNRTCAYMRKPQGLSHLFWGTVLWVGAVLPFIPVLPLWMRLLSPILFFYPPYMLQKYVNTLPKEIPPSKFRWIELLIVLVGWGLWGGVIFLLVKF